MAHRTLLFAFALSACSDSDSDDDGPTDGQDGPAHFEFNEHVPAAATRSTYSACARFATGSSRRGAPAVTRETGSVTRRLCRRRF